MYARSTENNWTQMHSTPAMLTYGAGENRLGISTIKIEKSSNPDKYHCSVILPESSKQAFLAEFRNNLNQFIRIKEVNLFGNFYLQFDDKDVDVIKAVLAAANKFLPFDTETRKTLLDFIKADDLVPAEGLKCSLV